MRNTNLIARGGMALAAVVILLAGAAVTPAAAELVVEPSSLSFGEFPYFTQRLKLVRITNTGPEIEALDVRIDDTNGYSDFFVERGGGTHALEPGETHQVWVGVDRGYQFDRLHVAGGVPMVPLSTPMFLPLVEGCAHGADVMDFGDLHAGETRRFDIFIYNGGDARERIRPSSDSPHFEVADTEIPINAGSSTYLRVVFTPQYEGTHTGNILLGEACDPIPVTGNALAPIIPTSDIVGLWFDEDLSVGVDGSVTVGVPFPAYLAMRNPSETVGVGGWELLVNHDANVAILGVAYEGQAFNVLNPPEFFVGLAEPLPYAPAVLLATLDLMVTDALLHKIELVAIQRASIPGKMAWAYGDDYAFKPLHPATGMDVVAWVTADESLPVDVPAPRGLTDGGRVRLAWPLPHDTTGVEGSHLYRAWAGREVRLTAAPVAAGPDGFHYLDDTRNLAAGTEIVYSYAVVRGGLEGPRSGALTMTVPAAPVLASELLPNRPNPFNPETAIHFVIGRDGPARLSVHDVGGRRLAVLIDGHRQAGAGQVVWRGRDAAGRNLPSGAYYVRLETGDGFDTRKIMLLK